MSFYTHSRPRLIEPNMYHRIIKKRLPIVKEPLIDYGKYGDMIGGYMKRNWSFIFIVIILIIILVYRYNVIKKDHQMKKARKQYIDQLIMNNYKKEKKLQEEKDKIEQMNNFIDNDISQTNIEHPNNQEIENDEIIQETFEEDLTFNDIFKSRLDQQFEPFYGNSSFAPF